MKVRSNGFAMKSKRLCRNAPWLGLLACFCILALGHKASTQDSPVPSTSTGQLGISPEEPVAPPQPIIIRVPAPAATNSSQKPSPKPDTKTSPDAGSKGSQTIRLAGSPDGEQETQAARVEMPPVPDPDPNNPVAVQSASLLKMAYDLKSEVDKTTKDMLSVSVVRRAADIEQLARKMRSK